MRRTSVLIALLVLAIAPAAARASGVPPLGARLTACTVGEDPSSRAAAFTASMPAAAGTKRMQMRFALQQRLTPLGPYKTLQVPGWGDWEKSDPGRSGFVFTKRVESLAGPASYRAVIAFKWLDRKGRAQRVAHRATPACEQPDPRPDLVLGGLDATPGRTADTAVYALVVSNEGRATAGPFTVTLAVDGVEQPPLQLGPIAVGAREHGTIVGARCTAGSTVTVTVDSGGAVDESAEDDDVVQRPCPSP
jgi:CARDB